MDHKPLSVQMLNLLLDKLNRQKVTRHKYKKTYRVNQIVSVNKTECKYAGSKGNKLEIKEHLQVKFTSPDENGIICMSLPLDKYSSAFL